ncbi:unnamed protein product, partial [Ceratitis capitata]
QHLEIKFEIQHRASTRDQRVALITINYKLGSAWRSQPLPLQKSSAAMLITMHHLQYNL